MKKEKLHEKVEFKNMRELVEWIGNTYGEKFAYSYRKDPVKGEVITKSCTQMRDDIRALATKLVEMGCTGKKSVIFGKYSYEWIVMYFSVLSIGGILVPLDKDWQGWYKGTDVETIWHWFDEHHSKGVGWLMNEYERV